MKQAFFYLLILTFFATSQAFAQTREELEAQKAEKAAQVAELQGQIDGLKGEISAINAQLVILPRWETGAFGTVGFNFNGFDSWLARVEERSTQSANIAITVNGYANRFSEKDFWRNALNINMGWVRFDNLNVDNEDEEAEFRPTNDVINFTSLYGYNLSKRLAASVLAEYRSTLATNFNNPGYLDIGVGVTWTPANNLVVVMHPLNQNFVFAEEGTNYESSLGAKIVADYTKELIEDLNWKSNLSFFISYKDQDLTNWTWINSVAFSIAKGLGVGFELGLRQNKQEALALLTQGISVDTNPLQTYYVLGLSYSLSAKSGKK